MAAFIIRAERSQDADTVAALHCEAFAGDLEARLVERLRQEDELLVSLVAESGGIIAGHIAIAPAGIAGAPNVNLGWLAPVGVRPEHQGQGIGSALVRAALDRAREASLAGVIVLGDPAYYGRFGFDARAAAPLESRFAGPALQFLPLMLQSVRGELVEPRAFAVFG